MTDVLVAWTRRPRARLHVAHHLPYLALVWVLVLALAAGGVAVSTGLSGTAKLLGALAITGVVAVITLSVLYLRRPVNR